MKYLLSFILLIVLGFSTIQAQESDSLSLWKLELQNGNIFIGELLEQSMDSIRFKAQSIGIINVNKIDVKYLKKISGSKIVEGVLWEESQHFTRYFFSPNAYNLKKGEGYYQNSWIFYNQISIGVTDHFSMGGGIIPLFLFGGVPTPVWITPKASIPIKKEKVNLGVGGLFATVIGEETGFGIAYGTSTFGSKDRNFTTGIGYGYADGDWAVSPTIMLGGIYRVGKKGYFVTENYIIGTGDSPFVLLSAGGRFEGKNLAIDYGGILPIGSEIDVFVAIPWLSLTFPFGNK